MYNKHQITPLKSPHWVGESKFVWKRIIKFGRYWWPIAKEKESRSERKLRRRKYNSCGSILKTQSWVGVSNFGKSPKDSKEKNM